MPPGGIRTHNPSKRAAAYRRLTPRDHQYQLWWRVNTLKKPRTQSGSSRIWHIIHGKALSMIGWYVCRKQHLLTLARLLALKFLLFLHRDDILVWCKIAKNSAIICVKVLKSNFYSLLLMDKPLHFCSLGYPKKNVNRAFSSILVYFVVTSPYAQRKHAVRNLGWVLKLKAVMSLECILFALNIYRKLTGKYMLVNILPLRQKYIGKSDVLHLSATWHVSTFKWRQGMFLLVVRVLWVYHERTHAASQNGVNSVHIIKSCGS